MTAALSCRRCGWAHDDLTHGQLATESNWVGYNGDMTTCADRGACTARLAAHLLAQPATVTWRCRGCGQLRRQPPQMYCPPACGTCLLAGDQVTGAGCYPGWELLP